MADNQRIELKLANVEKGGNIRFTRTDVRSSIYINKSFFAPEVLAKFFPQRNAEGELTKDIPDFTITIDLPVPDGLERTLSQEGDYVIPGRPAAMPTDAKGVEALAEQAEDAKRKLERAQKKYAAATERAKKAAELLEKKDATSENTGDGDGNENQD